MHGVKLVKHPVLVYLFYMCQIGMALCPLSNDKLFLKLRDSPVGRFQRLGMNFSLNTDDPLQFHNSLDPLLEEYLISSKAFDLSVHDMCEVAFNSVKMSTFDHETKVRWLGEHYDEQDGYGQFYTNPDKTNICVIRSDFRNNNLTRELNYVYNHAKESDRSRLAQAEREHWDTYFAADHNTKWLAGYKFFAEEKEVVLEGEDDKLPA
jgi:AMP deaminase